MTFDLTPYELPLVTPMQTSYRTIEARRGLLASLTEGGRVGWGDACPMEGWSARSLDETREHLVRATDRLGSELLDDVLDLLAFVPEARAALAGAAHDLAAQRAGVPLAALLDDRAAGHVRVNASIGALPLTRAAGEASLAVAAGFTAIKMKVGASPLEDDVQRIAAVRAAVGDAVEIRVDANGAWDPATALVALGRFADLGVSLCEEPVAGIDEIAAVGAESPVVVAVDESAANLADIARALATGTIGAIVVKPQAIGGPDLALKAIGLARAADTAVIVTSMIDSAIGVAHAVHVAAAAGGDTAHGVATSALLADDVARSLPIEDGHVLVPTVPGLGVSPR